MRPPTYRYETTLQHTVTPAYTLPALRAVVEAFADPDTNVGCCMASEDDPRFFPRLRELLDAGDFCADASAVCVGVDDEGADYPHARFRLPPAQELMERLTTRGLWPAWMLAETGIPEGRVSYRGRFAAPAGPWPTAPQLLVLAGLGVDRLATLWELLMELEHELSPWRKPTGRVTFQGSIPSAPPDYLDNVVLARDATVHFDASGYGSVFPRTTPRDLVSTLCLRAPRAIVDRLGIYGLRGIATDTVVFGLPSHEPPPAPRQRGRR